MVLYSTRILKDSALRHQRAGHMATEPLIMPSDGGLRFDSQFAVLRSILIRVSEWRKNVGAFKNGWEP